MSQAQWRGGKTAVQRVR